MEYQFNSYPADKVFIEFCLKENSKLLCLEIILDCRWCNNICLGTLIICNRKLVHVQNLNYPSLNLFNKFQLIMHSRNVSYDVIRKIIQIQITWQCGYFENKVFSWIWKFMFIIWLTPFFKSESNRSATASL